MFDFAGNHVNAPVRHLLLVAGVAVSLSFGACNKHEASSASVGPRTFASPQDAGKALADAAKSQNQDDLVQIFGPGSVDIVLTGDPVERRTSLEGFSKAYQVMNRWRKLGDGAQMLLVGADNQAFPIPLMTNREGKWYFDTAAGKDEILSRRIGYNEISTIGICAALVDAQAQYFSQKHGGVKQYAQKFISDAGQQNGLYWPEVSGQPKSPLGPLVAFATADGIKVEPGKHQPFNGYYFAMLDRQGPDAKGGAKNYVVSGKMTGGFAVVAYPAQYGDSGIMTFISNQSGVLLQKDLGTKTNEVASAITAFNPDEGWKPVEQ